MNGAMTTDDMMMGGLPEGLLRLALVSTILFTVLFLVAAFRGVRQQHYSYARFNVLRLSVLDRLIKYRAFQFALQAVPVFLLLLIIATGLLGVQSGSRNLAPVLTWTIWWALIIFDIVLLGRMWCLACPWYALATWMRRLSLWKRTEERFTLNLKWPRWLGNVYLAVFLFIVLTWLELGFGVTSSPLATAVLAIVMTALVIVPSLIFEKMSFCRYGCMIGRICGLYAMFAPVEVRAEDQATCTACRSRECRNGNENGYPCPTFQDLGTMAENTYCNVCSECFKSCPKDNVALNVRTFGADLLSPIRPRRDEAVMALVLLSLTSFHGLTMTPAWTTITDALQRLLDSDYLVSFSVGMTGILVIPSVIFVLVAATAQKLLRETGSPAPPSLPHPIMHYAYALIPLALFYHLSHNAHHLAAEGAAIMPVLSDPFGWGWDLFGTVDWRVAPILPKKLMWWIQTGLILTGYFYALRICLRISRQRYPQRGRVAGAMAFFALTMFAFNLFNIWLLAQPMVMRTGM